MKTTICDCCGERIKEDILLPKPFVIGLHLSGPRPTEAKPTEIHIYLDWSIPTPLDICPICIVKELKHQLGFWLENSTKL